MESNIEGKVIHVEFGQNRRLKQNETLCPYEGASNDSLISPTNEPHGSEVWSLENKPSVFELHEKTTDDLVEVEPTHAVFSVEQVVRLLNTTLSKIRSLERHQVVLPTIQGTHSRYTFQDLIALRTALELLDKGVRLRDVARAVTALRITIPQVSQPLSELRVLSDGTRVLVRSERGPFEAISGQMVIDFDTRTLAQAVVQVLQPAVRQHRARMAFELYQQASTLDEEPHSFEQAAQLYRQAIEQDPLLAIAYTNLGNILFRKGDDLAAEALYTKALSLEPEQPEAKYNLGYLMLERGQYEVAIRYFQGAIEADPKFADAYFNLAMAYEEIEETRQAEAMWRSYLELEPAGPWADIARQHLA